MTELADPAADGLAGARHTCRRLRDLAQTIETRFVTVGDRLYAAIGTIRGLASTLEGLSGELGRAELQEGAGRLREVASEVGGMSQALG